MSSSTNPQTHYPYIKSPIDVARQHPAPGVYAPGDYDSDVWSRIPPAIPIVNNLDTTITKAPPLISNAYEGYFIFESTITNGAFEVSLDNSEWSLIRSTMFSYDGLSAGTHVFQVRSVDTVHNMADLTPAVYEWLIDDVPPITFIDSGPNSIMNVDEADFTYHCEEEVQKWFISVDGSGWIDVFEPFFKVKNVGNGLHYIRIRAIDLAGNMEVTAKNYSWIVDIDAIPPNTFITSQPDPLTNVQFATFEFYANELNCTFQVQMDTTTAWTDATSPVTYANIPHGVHTFRVRSIDSFGNVDPSPAYCLWNVDLSPPNTFFTSVPNIKSNQKTGMISAASSKVASSYKYRFDGGTWQETFYEGIPFNDLANGVHSIEAYAIDMAGNEDPTPATYSWELDSTPPDTSLTVVPLNANDSGMFEFISDKPNCVFEVVLDAMNWTKIVGTAYSYQNLPTGSHTFSVRAVDTFGNFDPTPATHTWDVIKTIKVSGVVINGINNNPISQADIKITGANIVTNIATTSDTTGDFSISDVPSGTITVECSKPGFLTESITVTVSTDLSYNFILTPTLPPNAYRFILSWGSQPKDLDIRVYVPLGGNNYRYVSFMNMGSESTTPSGWLDVDNTLHGTVNVYGRVELGPETVTVYEPNAGLYQIYVYNYPPTVGKPPDITLSGATLKIYNDLGLQATIKVPTGPQGYSTWKVCTVDCLNRIVTPINQLNNIVPN